MIGPDPAPGETAPAAPASDTALPTALADLEVPAGRVDAVYARLGRAVVSYRWAILVFWVLAVAVTGATMPSLSKEINSNNSAFLKSTEPSIRAANLAAPLIGAGVGTKRASLQVVAVSGQPLDRADARAIEALIRRLTTIRGVDSIRLAGVSRDGRAAELLVRADASPSDLTRDATLIDQIVAAFTPTHARARSAPVSAPTPPGLHFAVAGQIATAVANQTQADQQGAQTQALSIGFVVVLLLLVFRSPLAAVITLIPAVVALLISGRIVGAIAASGALQISQITQILLIVLLIGAGTDYGLFLVFRVRENLRDGWIPRLATARAVVNVGESITASAGTVILALLTLLFATFGLYHDLGLPLAIGVLVMLLIGLTLQPALLAIFGRAAFWPVQPRPGPQKDGIWGSIAVRLVARPGVTLGIGLVIFGGLALGALGYRAGGFGGATTAPAHTSAAAGDAALAAHFPAAAANPADLVLTYRRSLWQDPSAIVRARTSLEASGRFSALNGPLDAVGIPLTPTQLTHLHTTLGAPNRLPLRPPTPLHLSPLTYDAYRATSIFLSPDGHTMQFQAALRAGTQDATTAMNATPLIRRALTHAARASGAGDHGVAGEAAAVYDINRAANRDLALIVPIAIVAIGLLLAAVLRSAIAPLYLIVSVGLSFLAALGAATIVFIDFGSYGGITFILPFLLFIFLLALGEDYNILVMTRIREEARELPLKQAVIKAVARSGSTVTTAGIILGGTFAVFALVGGGGGGGKGSDSFTPIGFGIALGVLMDTFLVRTLLVPSTVMLLGRWNWWPSRLGERD